MSESELEGWDRLRHGGLLLDAQRVRELSAHVPAEPLDAYTERELRRQAGAVLDGSAKAPAFVSFVLRRVCGLTESTGTWQRGSQVPASWGRPAVTGETVKPRQLWEGHRGGVLPVFLDRERRVGIGRGRRAVSHVLQWLRAGDEQLALLTNGRQWRLVFAGLDFDAFCEWDVDLWLEEGGLSPQVTALRTLLGPALWAPPERGAPSRLLQAVLDSRKGQAELSQVLGERVREAVEILVQAHGEALRERCPDVPPAEIYRAAVRVVMRLVVILFAESRELLPADNALYHEAYGLTGLLEELERTGARGGGRLARSWSAWPRVLALFRLVHQGSHHPELPVPAYGGELFAPGDASAEDGLTRALAVFETACFERELLSDREAHRILDRLTRTRIKLRQGRSRTWVPAPVDFSGLSTEYIGILYEGLLDFELKTAPAGDPVVFLAVGSQPALPLSRLEAMDDGALKSLLEKMKDTSSADDEETEEAAEAAGEDEEALSAEEDEEEPEAADEEVEDERHATRTRAETWARRAAEVGKLVRKPKGRKTPEKARAYEEELGRKARQLVTRVVLPGEWYLVRWGGTRKGSGTFYTRPGLAVPTVQRTLRPLAWNRPEGGGERPEAEARRSGWAARRPEEILDLRVVDPACGSGSFLVGALRYLTDALYASLYHHERIREEGDRSVVALLGEAPAAGERAAEPLSRELVPCRTDDDEFEPRLKAVLRRHVVERCLYGVDVDPLATELCRLSLWIETLDRRLPFSFLDHKVKCGNSLVGAWFDQFQHYPAMAWKNRDGGDQGHTNGVHYGREERTRELKRFLKETLRPDLRHFLEGKTLFDSSDPQEDARAAHDEALALLSRLHALPVTDAAERARLYREELLGSEAWRSLKQAMDLWCACWFWPAEALERAPLPSTLADPPAETRELAARLAAEKRFFHWELEFPDVFREPGSGFDAVLGNPPWENLQPNPEEFFSNRDPIFRSYGRLVKLEQQRAMFGADEYLEREWLDYVAHFNDLSNWVSHRAKPFGDPKTSDGKGTFPLGRGGKDVHARWRELRSSSMSYTSGWHPFRYQMGRIFTYRLFLEQCHALARDGGRIAQIVPSGIYSDAWSKPLRTLFLERCRWEWLFGFENRDKIFDIHRSFKFNPVIVEKGRRTQRIRTAFMRRKIEDWEHAEPISVPYSLSQVERFSPRSKAILEIQSGRDLEILDKIYDNSVLLGEEGPEGWDVKYKLEYMMNTDAPLFPPRSKWEKQGYRPDEYSRWLKGDWRPIEELWAELGVDPKKPQPAEIELEDWLFDTTAGPERREKEAQYTHGHLLKPGDVARTHWALRCAQPPYDILPIPRADIPAGVILSRQSDAWIREDRIEDVAFPLYVGKMIYLKDWAADPVEGVRPGRLDLAPDYLLSEKDLRHDPRTGARLVFRDIARTTDMRTFIPALVPGFPCGNVLPVLETRVQHATHKLEALTYLSSLVFDWSTRQRMSGTHLNWHIAESLALPPPSSLPAEAAFQAASVSLSGIQFGCEWRDLGSLAPRPKPTPPTEHERLRLTAILDAVAAAAFGLTSGDLRHILQGCDLPLGQKRRGESKGFWRVDKERPPELRHTVLAAVAFQDLEEKIRAAGDDREEGIRAFLGQNGREGWVLPETIRLKTFELGHDARAEKPQPVASRLGPRFFDWQLTQSADASWRECDLHARNLLGEGGYRRRMEALASGALRSESSDRGSGEPEGSGDRQRALFD